MSRDLGFLHSLPLTYAQRSGSFSAQTHSQQILQGIQGRGGVVGRLKPICGDHMTLFIASTPASALITQCQTLLTSSSVSASRVTLLFHLEIFGFYLFCVRWSPVFSNWLLQTSYQGARGRKSSETPEALTQTFAFTHTPAVQKLWRIPRIQCMSESSLRQICEKRQNYDGGKMKPK